MTENGGEKTQSILKKAIGVGTAVAIGFGLASSAKNSGAQEVPVVDNKPAETAPVQESAIAKEEFKTPTLSVAPKETITPMGRQFPDIVGSEIKVEPEKNNPNTVGKTWGSIANGVAGRETGNSWTDANGEPQVSGYYKAPNGLYYAIGTSVPENEK